MEVQNKAAEIVPVEVFEDARGRLIPFEPTVSLPFDLKRFFIIKDVPSYVARGDHPAPCNQLLVAVTGACRVQAGSADDLSAFQLDTCKIGLLLPKGCWVRLDRFAPNTVVIVACDDLYRGKSAPHD